MVTMTAMTTISATGWWLWLGITAVAMVGLLFTSYRYAVGYFLAGMMYWLGVEAISWVILAITPLDSFHAYILAVALSLLPLMGLLAIKDNLISVSQFTPQAILRLLKNRNKLLPASISQLFTAQDTVMPAPRIAGHKPFVLQKDTDFTQHFIRHTPVFDYES